MEAWVLEGIVAERVGVVDMSVAGLGLLLEVLPPFVKTGDRLRLRISIKKELLFEVDAIVRHVTPALGVCGVEIDRANEQVLRAFGQAVSELLERASFG